MTEGGVAGTAETGGGQTSLARRLEILEQRLHRVWEELTSGPGPAAVSQNPALAVLGTAVEDLHVAAADVAAAAENVDAERRRYQEMFELAPNGYLVTDMEGTILEANRAAGELLGCASQLLIGKAFAGFVVDDQRGLID
ncbi:MAG TPA: PAS domain-containing protein, partial [Dehalococcoidia bacterium]|nr:PAS domain-containing protein [Dehalococcoidia bacterium]